MNSKVAINGVKWTTLSSVIITLCSLLTISILTRYVEKADFGLIAIVVFALNFFELFNDMGISVAILHKQKMNQNEYSSLYWFNILLSLCLFAIVFLMAPLIAWFYKFEKLNYLLPLVGLTLLFNGIGRQFKIIQEKELRFKSIGIIEISAAIVATIISCILAIRGFGIYSLVFNTLIASFLSNILFMMVGFIHGHKITFFYQSTIVRPFLKMGLFQMGGQIANYFNRDFDILIVGKILGPQVLGMYSLSKQLVFRPFQLINPILLKVASPMLAKLQSSSHLKDSYLGLVNIIGSLNIVIYLLLFIFAPIVIKILYGEQYDDANWVVRILCFYMIFRSLGNPVGALTIATGKTYIEFYWNIALLVLIPVTVYLGSLGGIYTMCMSLVLFSILSFYPFWKLVINNLIDVTFRDYLLACFRLNYNFIKEIKFLKR